MTVRVRHEPAALLDCMQQLAVPGEQSRTYCSSQHHHGDWQRTNFLPNSSPKVGMDLQLSLLPQWKHNVYYLLIFHVSHNTIFFHFLSNVSLSFLQIMRKYISARLLDKGETISMPFVSLTLTLLMCRIWWAPNDASKWQMGFNPAFKGLKYTALYCT